MTPTRWLGFLSYLAELVPVLIVWRSGTRSPARLKVALLCLIWFGLDIWMQVKERHGQDNHWLTYLFDPVQTGLVFWLLFDWQTSHHARLAIRFLLPAYLIGVIGMMLTLDSAANFSLLTETSSSFVVICLAGYTIVTRSRASSGTSHRNQDWFWVCSGLILFFSLEAGGSPVLRYLRGQTDRSMLPAVLAVIHLLTTVVMLLLIRGVLCPEEALATPAVSIVPDGSLARRAPTR